jgi:hypothetical protein
LGRAVVDTQVTPEEVLEHPVEIPINHKTLTSAAELFLEYFNPLSIYLRHNPHRILWPAAELEEILEKINCLLREENQQQVLLEVCLEDILEVVVDITVDLQEKVAEVLSLHLLQL